MCTVTWSAAADGYDLFMNRDELHTRGHALPPRRGSTNGVDYLAPVDSDGGGSWIAVNEFGVTACLLNNYPPCLGAGVASGASSRQFTSRGRLLFALMSGRSVDAVGEELQGEGLDRFRPFYVFAIGAAPAALSASARLFRWDGRGKLISNLSPEPPITTSSFETQAVVRNRFDVYRKHFGAAPPLPADLAALQAYHRSHDPDRGPYSVCVHRDDAGTKSLSHVTVRPDGIAFEYTDGPPCENGRVTVAHLRRVGA